MPKDEGRIWSSLNLRPLALDVLVLNLIALFLAAQHAALAAANIHRFKELLFAIHALELNIGVAAGRWVILFVCVSVFKNLFGLDLQFFNLSLKFDHL